MTSVESADRGLGGQPRTDRPSYAPGYGKSWALIIGINYDRHGSLMRLENAEADAQAVRDQLVERYGFAAERVTLLLGPHADRRRIERELRVELTREGKIAAEDRVVIFYAGHGVLRTGNPNERPQGFLIPADDDGSWDSRVPIDELERAWRSTLAKHVLCIIDCCYSGLANTRRDAIVIRAFDNAMSQYYARDVITASTSEDQIYDVYLRPNGQPSRHSFLTEYLVEALRDGIPNYEQITAGNLYNHIRENVVRASNGRQVPTFTSYGHERGMFLLTSPEVRLPRVIYDGLSQHDQPVAVENAIVSLRQLFLNVEKTQLPGDAETGNTEQWRQLIMPRMKELLRGHENDRVIQEAGQLISIVLRGSPALQARECAEVAQLLSDNNSMRVQQAAAILTTLYDADGTDPSLILQSITDDKYDALESALVDGDSRLIESILGALVRFRPAVALPWLRLKLSDAQSGDLIHQLAFEALPALGSNIDIRLIKRAIERRPLNSTLRGNAIESLLALASRLDQQRVLNSSSRETMRKLIVEIARYDASPAVRRRMLEALVSSANRQSSAILVNALGDPSADVRERAQQLLDEQATATTHIGSLLDEGDWSVVLSSALVDPNGEVRERVLGLLSEQPIASPQIGVVLDNLDDMLANEPLSLVRLAACRAIGQIWRREVEAQGGPVGLWQQRLAAAGGAPALWWKGAFPSDLAPIWMQRLDRLCELLSMLLEDNTLEVQQEAARALGLSGDLFVAGAVLEYVRQGLAVRRAIERAAQVADDVAATQHLQRAGPALFPELINAFLQLLAGMGQFDAALWPSFSRDIELMLDAAREFGDESLRPVIAAWLDQPLAGFGGDQDETRARDELHLLAIQALMIETASQTFDPAFLPLLQHWLAQQPEHFGTIQDRQGAQGELHLLAIRALGKQPHARAVDPARELTQRALARDEFQDAVLFALVDCWADLGGTEAVLRLLDLLEAPGLQDDAGAEVRMAAASSLLKMSIPPAIGSDVRAQLRRRSTNDPASDVQDVLARVVQRLSPDAEIARNAD